MNDNSISPQLKELILSSLGPKYRQYDDGSLGFILWNRTSYPLGTTQDWGRQLVSYRDDPRDEDGNPCTYGITT